MSKPTIVCLCGSSKFKAQTMGVMQRETLRGKIVLQHGFYHHVDMVPITDAQKRALDDLMLAKIELSDEVIVVNINSYVGQSTGAAIAHAKRLGKPVSYLEE